MLLVSAIAILTAVVIAGAWLGSLYLMVDRPPSGLYWPGLLHGATGLAGFIVLVLALSGPAPSVHARRMGAGAFGVVSAVLIGTALIAGGVILLTHLRRRAVSNMVVAVHGLLAISGLTLLVTYLTMLHGG